MAYIRNWRDVQPKIAHLSAVHWGGLRTRESRSEDDRDRLEQLLELDKRRAAILKSLDEHGNLSDELETRVKQAKSLTELEDIYLPYRPKRRTRATIARERGLEPLAKNLFAQLGADPLTTAQSYVDPDKDVGTAEQALAGARDIMAEWVSEDQYIRQAVRAYFAQKAVIRSKIVAGKEEEGAKFRDYFDWEEPIAAAPSHRVLAMRRGEREGILIMRLEPPEESALAIIEAEYLPIPFFPCINGFWPRD